ncbi:hypothetical protein CI109_101155 [Kwoniella shandongensis]|uniref:Uncharacterized protein n=1 Tax=Kwoniella shandongensis TaxID=1734106 RepID=A0A5M6C4Y3_9TREE|nr:uncharacterized protein CI109_001624 [Kwoniella shandongensis]KAA5530217.1 hypothetical protein CI109_001624 [Kwoniella shandongensis]
MAYYNFGSPLTSPTDVSSLAASSPSPSESSDDSSSTISVDEASPAAPVASPAPSPPPSPPTDDQVNDQNNDDQGGAQESDGDDDDDDSDSDDGSGSSIGSGSSDDSDFFVQGDWTEDDLETEPGVSWNDDLQRWELQVEGLSMAGLEGDICRVITDRSWDDQLEYCAKPLINRANPLVCLKHWNMLYANSTTAVYPEWLDRSATN